MSMHPLLGTLILALAACAHGDAAQRTHDAEAAAGRKDDLARFRADFLSKDRSYSGAARAEAETRLAKLEASPEASQAYLELELARIAALADNGHTVSFPVVRSRRYNRVGIRLVPFAEEFHVLRAEEPHADLLGARLVAIDDQPVARLRETARSLVGGSPGRRDRFAPYFFESPEQMHALGVIAAGDAAVYRFESRDGTAVERRLAGDRESRERSRGTAERWLFPQRMASEGASWSALLAPEKAPWAFQDPDAPFRWRDAPEIGALVIDMRQNNDSHGRPIGDFLREMKQRIEADAPRHLVLDLRLNGGGDLTRTREFMQGLPGLVPGRVFVLTSPWTFSAAISSLGYLEQAAPDRVTIVGEMVGDRLQFWAEGTIVELPHCGAFILYATERHDYLTGCRPFDDCHAQVKRHPIAVPDLDPDIAAPWTIEAYRSGRDPGMEAVAAALREDTRGR